MRRSLIGWRRCNSANSLTVYTPDPTFAPGKGIGGIFAFGHGLGPTNTGAPLYFGVRASRDRMAFCRSGSPVRQGSHAYFD